MGKKEKLIESAQKLIQKGQLDKAVKEYQDAVALDPGDQRVRQRLAELLIRVNRLEDARAEFEVIGKSLTGNGFYLKAIAVYKQIEKLFPDDVSVILTLASLNEKHGLPAQAMAEYKRAYDYYERFQNMAEGVKILESMQKADPQNTNIRLKLAEVFHQLGKQDDSFQVFSDLAGVLIERRDDAAFGKLAARIEQLFPEKSGFTCAVIEQQIENGNTDAALQALHVLLKADPRNLRVWQLMVQGYARLEQRAKLKTACQHFLKFFPDELLPKEHYARCLLAEEAVETLFAYLESCEQSFYDAGAASVMVELYSGLAELAPIDVRILKGALRACTVAGDKDKADSFSANIVAMSAVRAKAHQGSESVVEQQELQIELPDEVAQTLELNLELEASPESDLLGYGEIQFEEQSAPQVALEVELEQFASDMYEIEVELDTDLDVEPAASTGSWFDTVSDIFDNIGTTSGKVKFGAGVESGDAQSHYDLGMAFREMGLFDEAINEFRNASEDPERQVECLIQQGACLRDKGDLPLAENALKSLLAAPGLSVEDSSTIRYELALTYEVAGRSVEAAELYAEIEATNPAFRDVKARLEQSAEGGGAGGFDFSEDDLLDFELK